MEHMQEAYEVLIDKLKKEIETLHKETDMEGRKNSKIINMLIENILQKMPKTAALQLGKEIDEAVGEGGDIEWYMMELLAVDEEE